MKKIVAERGYLIPAINTTSTDYVACAERLMRSIHDWHPDANVTILTKEMLPYGCQEGYANDWQVFYSSPYRQTIKLEADMFCSGPIDHWWTMFEHRDVVVSTGARNFYNKSATSRFYRKIFDDNGLPDVYNAITYWRLSNTAKQFFDTVRSVFENWTLYRQVFRSLPDQPDTDLVYAVAALMEGTENVTLPCNLGPQIVHMKKHMVPIVGNDWTKELVWELDNRSLRLNTVAQHGLVHYHVKDWNPYE